MLVSGYIHCMELVFSVFGILWECRLMSRVSWGWKRSSAMKIFISAMLCDGFYVWRDSWVIFLCCISYSRDESRTVQNLYWPETVSLPDRSKYLFSVSPGSESNFMYFSIYKIFSNEVLNLAHCDQIFQKYWSDVNGRASIGNQMICGRSTGATPGLIFFSDSWQPMIALAICLINQWIFDSMISCIP